MPLPSQRFGFRLAVALALSIGLHGAVLKSSDWLVGEIDGDRRNQYEANSFYVDFLGSRRPPVVTPKIPQSDTSLQIEHASAAVENAATQSVDKEPRASNQHIIQPPGSAGKTGQPFGPWYYTSRYLHRRPAPTTPILPVYPQQAMTVSGRILLLLFVSDSGTIDKYEIVESEPAGIFDTSAIEAFVNVRYSPGQITGYPVRSQLLIEITYDPGLPPQTTINIPDKDK